MTIKSLFFSLFLYISLAWVGAAYLYTGPEIIHRALLWTAIGLIAVLAFLILSRLFGWWRLWRARRAARPAPSVQAPAPVHADDQAMSVLIAQANAALAKAPAFAGQRRQLSAFPLYLLVGAEGTGKTSTFLASGLEPQLLAGEGSTPASATRLANIWFAKNAIFVELGGRSFAGDLVRWSQLLRLLRGNQKTVFWRRLWADPEPHTQLKGVIAFCASPEFTGASSDPQKLERTIRGWQERLRAIAEVFGAHFPVYLAITKCDNIAFFADFFRRLPKSEADQVLGCTLETSDEVRSTSERFAEAEAKRLTASFRRLYHAVAQRRLAQLAREPNPAQRSGVYEFPRELKRIRSPLVQLLTELFSPNPLAPNAVFRGYYFTGMLETEEIGNESRPVATDSATPALLDTGTFRGDATQIFQTGNVGNGGRQSRFALRWLFVADLFHKVVLPDPLARRVQSPQLPIERYRRAAFAAVCGVCALLCYGFIWSWSNNRELLAGVRAAVNTRTDRHIRLASIGDLQALDGLREEIVLLRHHLPWTYHLGLYSGDRVLPLARTAYFHRFQRALLVDLNALMISDLNSLPASPDSNAPSDPVYRVLKTHLTVTSGNCNVDPVLVSRVLKEYRRRMAPVETPEWQALADRQIDFYAAELANGNPTPLPQDSQARDQARRYLQQIRGVDRIYANLLANTESHVPKRNRLGDLAPNYTQVLHGTDEVSPAFTGDGWSFFERAAKESNSGNLGDACVLGEAAGTTGTLKQSAETVQALDAIFIRGYVEAWRQFVSGFSVVRYAGPEDAAHKLEILADHKSPLLAVLALTANQTNFAAAHNPGLGGAVEKGIDKLFGSKNASGGPNSVASVEQTAGDPKTPADIARYFQPVHWVEPPGSETWVVDKNTAYIEALSQLGHSMQAIADSGRNPDPGIYQTASQNYQKALDTVQQIAKGFKPVGVGGLDTAVEKLLEDPIRLTSGFIKPPDPGKEVNAALRAFCASEKNVLRKYPFQSSAGDGNDVNLADLSGLLQPVTGAFWKFQQQYLADLAVKEGSQWKPKDPGKKPQITAELLKFLNEAQMAADAFYSSGSSQPQLVYTLRPKLDPSQQDRILELEIDGKPFQWTTPLQHQFSWPSQAGVQNPEAVGRFQISGTTVPFASEAGTWAIFRVFGDAEPRDLGVKVVEWKYSRGLHGRAEEIKPPVRLEIVGFPNNVDVFNPKFWGGFQCPSTAVQ